MIAPVPQEQATEQKQGPNVIAAAAPDHPCDPQLIPFADRVYNGPVKTDTSDRTDSMDAQTLYTTGDVAKILDVSPRTVARLCDNGEIKAQRLSPRSPRRITQQALQTYITQNGLDLLIPVKSKNGA